MGALCGNSLPPRSHLRFPLLTATTPVCGQETSDSSSYAPPRREVPDVWPSFTIPAVREDWFDFKAEVDADKGLLTRIAPCARRRLADNGINVFGWYMMAFQGNAAGGIDQDFEATGLNDFGLDFDLEKMCCAGWPVRADLRLLGLGPESDGRCGCHDPGQCRVQRNGLAVLRDVFRAVDAG